MKKIIRTFLLIVCGLASTNALAHNVSACETNAVIQSIDFTNRVLNFTHQQGSRFDHLIWKNYTQFLRDGKPVSAKELNAGAHLKVYYRSPFFGKPFATKIIWSQEN